MDYKTEWQLLDNFGIFSVIVTFMVGAIVGWRAWVKQRALFIEHYPYAAFLDRRLAARRPELSPVQRKRVLAALREYFQVGREAKNRLVAMPSQVVDDAWHEFIRCPRRCHRFCEHGLGRFLHHTPAEAMRAPTDAQQRIRRAWRLACQHEGIDPRRPQSLPLLVSIDATLGIVGGFVYHLDCRAVAKERVGGGFCASHIGCQQRLSRRRVQRR